MTWALDAPRRATPTFPAPAPSSVTVPLDSSGGHALAHAPLHVLIVPRKHIATLNDTIEADAFVMGKMLMAAQDIARKEGIAKSGYRLVMNCNDHGGQSVYHIHMHLLGGRQMEWPPG